MTDHLARLCFEGAGSSGDYTPLAYSLRLAGVTQPADHVVYLHEVHHAALNDVTAWGTALHVYARLPGDESHQFGVLLDACRTTHESLATFASVEIASARHGPLDEVLAVYPDYVPLYGETAKLLASIAGPGRRQIIASALARLCMQTPVLDEIVASGLGAFRLAAVRDIDTPDGRWRWFLRQGPQVPGAAAAAADRAIVKEFGPAALDSDGPDGDLAKSTDRSHDEAWECWEASAYEHLRAALARARARTIGFNGHQDGTAALLGHVAARHGDIGVRPAMTDEQRHSDAAVASSVLQQVRHDLSGGDRYRAALVQPADAASLVEMLAVRPVLGDLPAMIVDARPGNRLAALYRWPGGLLPEQLRTPGGPVVAVRVMADDGEPGTVIGHAVLPTPQEVARLSERWQRRGPLAVCASSSCFADVAWKERWLPALTSAGTMFVLVDVEPDRFIPAWSRAGLEVIAIGVDVDDTSGRRTALVFSPDDGATWWLVVANDITVNLMLEYLRDQLGPRLRGDAGQFAAIRDVTTVVVSHLLATESFVSFDALGGGHAQR